MGIRQSKIPSIYPADTGRGTIIFNTPEIKEIDSNLEHLGDDTLDILRQNQTNISNLNKKSRIPIRPSSSARKKSANEHSVERGFNVSIAENSIAEETMSEGQRDNDQL